MNTKAALGLSAGALAIGLLAGIALGGGGDEKTIKATGPGPTKTVDGVPVGYARSKEGAINAALAYEGALGAMRRADKNRRAAALTAMAVPEQRDTITKSSETAFEFFDTQFGSEGIIRSGIFGYRVKTYDENSAEVELWGVSVVGRPETVPVRSGWTTRTVRLRWIEGDWKLNSLPDEVAGPTPQDSATPSDSAQVLRAAREFEEVRLATTALP